MKYLFDEEGLRMLEAFCYADALFSFDFDGTLAPIVPNPDDAKVSQKTDDYLRSLHENTSIVVISGRSRPDLLKRLPFKVDFAIGNHGLEGLPSSTGSLDIAADMTRQWHEKLKPALVKTAGVVIEDKSFSLAIHYRQASDKRKVKLKLLELASSLVPAPRILLGKYVVNLVASGAPHKGVALLELMLRTGKRAAVYVGDDENDEDVFRLGEESLLTIRVGEDENSAALFYLKNQGEIDRMLRHCLDTYKKIGRKRSL
ncbi:MAG TPA: trehalose-phosphatase [Oligoflexus sp.]|uniref:trehalose-phosphatase n=1 Tax=Oligoflexus sp. TaxID=1971216 RepID=UPI002D7E492D|nr:trehalose-phosphatase [Oligoflexus sp.]HET9238305.1 trehalose-phosphatase [Oligoflexus sp.]